MVLRAINLDVFKQSFRYDSCGLKLQRNFLIKKLWKQRILLYKTFTRYFCIYGITFQL